MTERFIIKGFLFDLDGTLIDTTPLVEQSWREFAQENGLDANKILATSHGRRTTEVISQWKPQEPSVELAAAEFERKLAHRTEGLLILPGVNNLLAKIPHDQKAIYTGGSRYLAELRLKQCHMPFPKAFETANDVTNGKPHPEGYLKAAAGLDIEPKDCVVFEDAPAGVRAGRAAGMTVIACLTTHTYEQLSQAGANYIVDLLSDVDVKPLSDGNFEVLVKVRAEQQQAAHI
ncbi:HAD-like domain-containing protein [Syncephalastrum racemosum]|uniref:HAD-like domain-containing protein n=1 Tax=Syncephalastrum racemosum TaxID=13706 RepID=A0A1X2HCU7_SYNRA|nr:HAD-like domain-containing protein [Syncephalastrum racemosum]